MAVGVAGAVEMVGGEVVVVVALAQGVAATTDPVSGYKLQVATFKPSDVTSVDALDRPGAIQGDSREPPETLQEPSWGPHHGSILVLGVGVVHN